MINYSNKIKEIRKITGLSVPKLATKINIPARTIVSYEQGRTPSLDFVTQLCNTLNVNANWFIADKGSIFMPQDNCGINTINKDEFRKMFVECMEEIGFLKV